MYNIIPLILILISLSTIIIIAVRKFSALANLDIETIQAEREAKFKEQIISNRIKRSYYKFYGRLKKVGRPLAGAIGIFSAWFYDKLVEFRDNYKKESVLDDSGSEAKINKLFAEAQESEKNGDFEKPESNYIEIISLDSKNFRAFKELGKLYFNRKDFNEAKQTMEHAIKLLEYDNLSKGTGFTGGQTALNNNSINPDIEVAVLYFELALVCRAINNIEGAMTNINRSLSIEPNNPRYLDTKLEISIIKKDKISALEAYEKLEQANPENQKLGELKEQIDEL